MHKQVIGDLTRPGNVSKPLRATEVQADTLCWNIWEYRHHCWYLKIDATKCPKASGVGLEHLDAKHKRKTISLRIALLLQ